MSSVLVTVMPYWAERLGVPRTVGVEFLYGHPLGQPGDRDTQMGVIREALRMLEEAARSRAVSASSKRNGESANSRIRSMRLAMWWSRCAR